MILYCYKCERSYGEDYKIQEFKIEAEEKPKTYKLKKRFKCSDIVNKINIGILQLKYNDYFMIDIKPSLEEFKQKIIESMEKQKEFKIIEINNITRQIQLLQR